jgi:tetratricopeptide (TPR) repeat protein
MAGHYRDALQAAERAVELATTTEDAGLLARERLQLGVALFTLGRLTEASEQLERAIEGADAVGDLETLAEALRMASWVYQTYGTFAESQTAQVRGIAVAQRLGDVVGMGHTLFLDALLAFYLGEWDRARAIAENSLTVFRALGVSHLSAYPPLGLGWLATIEGHREAGEQYLVEAEALALQSGPAQVLRFITALRAECELLAGQPELAHTRLLPWFSGEPMQERTRLELSVLRAWAAVEMGLEAEAEALVAETVRSTRACHMHLVLPDALRVQALWAMRQQRWEEAASTIDEAITLSHATPYPYAEAKALYVAGRLWATIGEPVQARAHFEEARAICRGLGERLYGEAIERHLASAIAAHATQDGRGQGRQRWDTGTRK